MKRDFRSAVRVLTGIALTAAVGISSAQTPAQMEYERQQREYRQQQERQREQQQQQQQLMNENARRQQEQSSRDATRADAAEFAGYAPTPTQGSGGASRTSGLAAPTHRAHRRRRLRAQCGRSVLRCRPTAIRCWASGRGRHRPAPIRRIRSLL